MTELPVLYSPAESYEAVVSWARDLTLIANGGVHTYDLIAEVSYSPRDPKGSLAKQPGLVAWWGSVVALIGGLAAQQKLKVRSLQARAARDIRREFAARNLRATEDRIKEEVRASESLRQEESKLIEIQVKLAQAKYVMAALHDRKEALMALLTGQRGQYYGATPMRGATPDTIDDDTPDTSEG